MFLPKSSSMRKDYLIFTNKYSKKKMINLCNFHPH